MLSTKKYGYGSTLLPDKRGPVAKDYNSERAHLVQLVERLAVNEKVEGSSPSVGVAASSPLG